MNTLLSGIGFNLASYLRGLALEGKHIFCFTIQRTLSSLGKLFALADGTKFYSSFSS